jgi:hypothetical protein
MSYYFEATKDYFSAQKKVTVLIKFALREDKKNNDLNRELFLGLAVVQLVTNFQVFVESVLKEFEYSVRVSNKSNNKLSIFLRLKNLNLAISNANFIKKLENPSQYDLSKLIETKTTISYLHKLCHDDEIIHDQFKIETKFPLGKQGLNELKALIKQIEGVDIFSDAPFDINKLNEILNRRHNIIHENRIQQLTEPLVRNYRDFMSLVVRYISNYLKSKKI